MATTQAPTTARAHLERLAEALQRRGRHAALGDRTPHLRVSNPAAPVMAETVRCEQTPNGWQYMWSWRTPIGPVEDVEVVADAVANVLRAVDE